MNIEIGNKPRSFISGNIYVPNFQYSAADKFLERPWWMQGLRMIKRFLPYRQYLNFIFSGGIAKHDRRCMQFHMKING